MRVVHAISLSQQPQPPNWLRKSAVAEGGGRVLLGSKGSMLLFRVAPDGTVERTVAA